ncbi:MAG TPA: hypothetical protein VK283_05720 [Acidimicrobiales bacterium]|nr:hypothetical protein [Acidimicrobiales bacterium]
MNRTSLAVAVALVLSASALTGCGIVKDATKIAHSVEGNKATIDAFTNKVKAGEATTFEATYVTTGSSPTTIVYAVEPPNGLAFKATPSGGGSSVDIIVNSAGEYSCTPPATGSGTAPTCQKLGTADASTENKVFEIYTPAHWTAFLQGFSFAAGLAGDKVTSSTMTVNGFAMQCVDLVAPGVPGTSTICTTAQNILGYVKVASDTTSFEITSYSAAPATSLFELPAGARITTAPSQITTPQSGST